MQTYSYIHTCLQPCKTFFKFSVKSLVPIRQKSTTEEPYYQYKFKPELELAINTQIQAEQQASQEYLNMAVHFLHPSVSRPGIGGYFMKMYEEEVGHTQQVIKYQLLRGGKVLIPCLRQPASYDKLSMLEAFQVSLQMEKMVTELIVKLISAAEKAKDYQCADHFTSGFLIEQKTSVNELAHHVTQLSRLCDEQALYLYDLHLGKTHPYSLKKKC